MFDNLPSAIGQVKAGKLRALAVTSSSPVPFAPEVPTISTSGVPGFDVTAWFALYAPVGTPQTVIDKLNAEVNKALALDEVKQAYESAGFQLPPAPNSAAQLGKFTEAEVNKWAAVIKKTGLKEN
jgi:tripartite-type tricarboxylate transporter receptor subunit TctC